MLETHSMLFRKFITTLVSTITISIILAFLTSYEDNGALNYNQGNAFLGWLLIYFMYAGVIILIYGNLVSIGLEFLFKKWLHRLQWLYILLHGVFGLVNGLIFQEKMLALYGMAAALLYALIDRWIYARREKYKSVKLFLIVPIGTILIIWGFLQIISPSMAAFTKEDAVKFVTSGEGTTIDFFPKEIGIWQGIVEGFQVELETSVKEIGDEIYKVTFTEHWKNEKVNNTWSMSYRVERGSSQLDGEEGIQPSYYKNMYAPLPDRVELRFEPVVMKELKITEPEDSWKFIQSIKLGDIQGENVTLVHGTVLLLHFEATEPSPCLSMIIKKR
jgi:hypothetical protein